MTDDGRKKMRVQYFVKDTFFEEFDALKNRAIRSILWNIEVITKEYFSKDSEDYQYIRKTILDNINNYNRDVKDIIERDIIDTKTDS